MGDLVQTTTLAWRVPGAEHQRGSLSDCYLLKHKQGKAIVTVHVYMLHVQNVQTHSMAARYTA